MQRLSAPELPTWLNQHLNGFTRYSVELDGRQMHVMEAGDPNGRPVLMMHGNPTWGFLYRRVVAALGDAPLRIILPDMMKRASQIELTQKSTRSTSTEPGSGSLLMGLICATSSLWAKTGEARLVTAPWPSVWSGSMA